MRCLGIYLPRIICDVPMDRAAARVQQALPRNLQEDFLLDVSNQDILLSIQLANIDTWLSLRTATVSALFANASLPATCIPGQFITVHGRTFRCEVENEWIEIPDLVGPLRSYSEQMQRAYQDHQDQLALTGWGGVNGVSQFGDLFPNPISNSLGLAPVLRENRSAFDMLRLLHCTVPSHGMSILPKRNGQEVSVNMQVCDKQALVHLNHWGQMWLHHPVSVTNQVVSDMSMHGAYSTLKAAFTVTALYKDEVISINLLDVGVELTLCKFEPRSTNDYVAREMYMSPGVSCQYTIPAGSVIAIGMEDLYSKIANSITVKQPDRKVDFRVGRLV